MSDAEMDPDSRGRATEPSDTEDNIDLSGVPDYARSEVLRRHLLTLRNTPREPTGKTESQLTGETALGDDRGEDNQDTASDPVAAEITADPDTSEGVMQEFEAHDSTSSDSDSKSSQDEETLGEGEVLEEQVSEEVLVTAKATIHQAPITEPILRDPDATSLAQAALPSMREELPLGFKIDEQIGKGACYDVYRATKVSAARQVALKVASKDLPDRIALQMVREETHLLNTELLPRARERFPSFSDICEENPMARFEELGGKPLSTKISESKHKGGLPKEDVREYFLQILDAVEAIHDAGYVHRDIKPSAFVERLQGVGEQDGSPKRSLMMVDWSMLVPIEGDHENSVARTQDESLWQSISRPEFEDFRGKLQTPVYAAPDQALGKNDLPVDIYQLGTLLSELVTGENPKLVRAKFPKYARELKGLIDDCRAEYADRESRPQSVEELRERFLQIMKPKERKELKLHPAIAAVVDEVSTASKLLPSFITSSVSAAGIATKIGLEFGASFVIGPTLVRHAVQSEKRARSSKEKSIAVTRGLLDWCATAISGVGCPFYAFMSYAVMSEVFTPTVYGTIAILFATTFVSGSYEIFRLSNIGKQLLAKIDPEEEKAK